MKKIKALRQFSHFHEGNFLQHEERTVPDTTAAALVGMGLAEEVQEEGKPSAKAKRGRKNADD